MLSNRRADSCRFTSRSSGRHMKESAKSGRFSADRGDHGGLHAAGGGGHLVCPVMRDCSSPHLTRAPGERKERAAAESPAGRLAKARPKRCPRIVLVLREF